MITFLTCLALLIAAYFTYGRYLERLVGIDPAAQTPCSRLYDGVDYVPLPRWRIFLIQRLTADSEITFAFSSASDESKESNTLRVFRKVSLLTVPWLIFRYSSNSFLKTD